MGDMNAWVRMAACAAICTTAMASCTVHQLEPETPATHTAAAPVAPPPPKPNPHLRKQYGNVRGSESALRNACMLGRKAELRQGEEAIADACAEWDRDHPAPSTGDDPAVAQP